ncbi:glycoside hydrolase family 127 protein [Candidatus Aerophobetes bacterium]|nr:glycoside hydrolase family 127 protein [Candidatus Aerophobetes bacterium]
MSIYEEKKKGIVHTDNSPFVKLKSVPISAVTMNDGFWKKRMKKNVQAGIPSIYRLFKEKGIFDNFIRVYKSEHSQRRGPLFTDSDVYKWMEALSFVLQSEDNSGIKNMLDEVIEIILPAQGKDGYLNTYFVEEKSKERFKRLETDHELYCAGHFFQAAIAHHRATGDRRLLNAAIKFADYLCKVFGPGKRAGWAGHPEIEMSLIELYRETGNKEYLRLAGFFLKQMKFTSLREIIGHAVRAVYLCSGAADYYAETGEEEFWDSLISQWKSMVKTKSYLTGGVGSRYQGEAFGAPYELPNEGAYAETCAAIGSIFWNWRMLLITGEAKFADVIERTLYNGFLSGVSLSGDKYFYVNPLTFSPASLFTNTTPPLWDRRGKGPRMRCVGRRQPWYDCTCCPTNVLRMIASLPGYFFSISKEGVWIHLYDNCSLNYHLYKGTEFTLHQKSNYPWEGKIEMEIFPEREERFSLFLRVPSWCEKIKIIVNGKDIPVKPVKGYQRVNRVWKKRDKILLDLEIKTKIMVSHRKIRENIGKIALQRGPLVYCFEGIDNPGISVLEAALKINKEDQNLTSLEENYEEISGEMVRSLKCKGVIPSSLKNETYLYGVFKREFSERYKDISLVAIPYYTWANRKLSEMTVWIPYILS